MVSRSRHEPLDVGTLPHYSRRSLHDVFIDTAPRLFRLETGWTGRSMSYFV